MPKFKILKGKVPELSSVELASQPQVAGADSPEPVSTEVAGFRGLVAPRGRRQALLVLTAVSGWPLFYIPLTSAIRRLSCKKLAGFRESNLQGKHSSRLAPSHLSVPGVTILSNRSIGTRTTGSCSGFGTTRLGRSTRIDEYADTCVAEVNFPPRERFQERGEDILHQLLHFRRLSQGENLDLSRSFGLFS